MAKSLQLSLVGDDSSLSDALNEVRDAAGQAKQALEEVKDEVQSIDQHMQNAAQAGERLEGKLDEIASSGALASRGVDSFSKEARGATIQSNVLNQSSEQLSGGLKGVGASGYVAAEGLDQAEEQAEEARNAMLSAAGATNVLSGSSGSAVPIQQMLQQSLDETADEADDAAGSMLRASGAAEILSLQSSALSINLGPFTVALRNITTQVPLLVASVGNLTSALAALGGVVGGVGIGGLGVAIGGAVAEVERIAGPMATMEEKMQAMSAIGKEFMSMMREAIAPLVEAEGAGDTFISLLEEIATITNVVAKDMAESFENGGLGEAMEIISDSMMANIEEISAAFTEMVDTLGPTFARGFQSILQALPGFIAFITDVFEDITEITGQISGSLLPFAREVMELGRNIADGLIPVLGTFFNIMTEVASVLNEGGGEAVATAAKIFGLLVAVNRLAGIVGSVILPLTSLGGSLISIAQDAERFGQAFFLAGSRFTAFASDAVSGFGRLATAFTGFLPMVDQSEGAFNVLSERLADADGETRKLSQSLSLAAGTFDEMVQSSSLVDAAQERIATSTRSAKRALSGYTGPITKAADGMKGYGVAVGSALRPVNLFESATNRLADGIEATDSLVGGLATRFGELGSKVVTPERRIRTKVVPELGGPRKVNEKVTGLEALREKGRNIAGEIESGFPATRQRISDTLDRFGSGVERAAISSMEAIGDAGDRFGNVVTNSIEGARKRFGPSIKKFGTEIRDAGANINSARKSITGPLYNFANALNQGFMFATDHKLDAGFLDGFITTLNTKSNTLGGAWENLRDTLIKPREFQSRTEEGTFGPNVTVTGFQSLKRKVSVGYDESVQSAKEGAAKLRDSVIDPVTFQPRGDDGTFQASKTVTGVEALKKKISDTRSSVVSSTSAMANEGADNLADMTAEMSEETDRTHSTLSDKWGRIKDSISTKLAPETTQIDMRQAEVLGMDTDSIDTEPVTVRTRLQLLRAGISKRVSGFVDSIKSATPSVEEIKSSVYGAGEALGGAFKTAVADAWSGVKRFGGGLIDGAQKVVQFAGRIKEIGPSLQGMADSLRAANGDFLRLSTYIELARGGISSLTGRLGTLKTAIMGTSVSGYNLGSSLQSIRSSARSTVAVTELQTESADELKSALSSSAKQAGATDLQLRQLGNGIEEIAEDGVVAASTSDELAEQLREVGVSAKLADSSVDGLNDEYAETSWRAGVTAKANSVLSGSFATVGASLSSVLLPALGALVASLAVLVLVGGAVTAVLASIGKSGQSAEEITRKLKGMFMDLVDAVLPLFLESAEFVIELVRSITAVFGELVQAGQDVAVALGLMEEPAESGAEGFQGFIDTVDGFVQAINPVIDAIGEFIRYTAGHMIVAIRNTADAFVGFINTLHAPTFMAAIKEGAKGIANAIGGIEGVMKGVVNIVGAFISGLVKLTAILAIVGTIAGIAALGVGGFATALWSAIAGLVTISAPISGTAAAIGALIVAVVAILEYLGVFDVILGVIGATVGIVMDIIMGLVGVIVSAGKALYNFLQIGTIISWFSSAWDALSAGISKVTNALGVVFGVFKKVFGVIKQMASGIVSLLIEKAINGLITGVNKAVSVVKNLINSFINLITRIPIVQKLITGLQKGFNFVKNVIGDLISAIVAFPAHITDAFNAVVKHIEGFVNTFVDAVNKIIDGYNSIPGVDDIGKLDSVELTKTGEAAAEAQKEAKSAAEEAAPEDATVTEEDTKSGFQTGMDMKNRDNQQASGGGTPSGIEYYEGDVNNEFRQQISADPEDKSQISRVAKDAMAEANSFSRRQQGGQ